MDLAGLVHRYQRTLLITVMMFKLGKTQLLPPPPSSRLSLHLPPWPLSPSNFLRQTSEGDSSLFP